MGNLISRQAPDDIYFLPEMSASKVAAAQQLAVKLEISYSGAAMDSANAARDCESSPAVSSRDAHQPTTQVFWRALVIGLLDGKCIICSCRVTFIIYLS